MTDKQLGLFDLNESASGVKVQEVSADIFTVPEVDEDYIMPEQLEKFTDRLAKTPSRIRNILLTGPQSAGKTTAGRQIAARMQRKCFVVDCGTLQEPSQFFGSMHLGTTEEGASYTYFRPSAFVAALKQPGMVIILDEINRVESPKVLNALFPILDERRRLFVEDIGDWVDVAEGVLFIATANMGSKFHGIEYLDTALHSRFVHIFKMLWPDKNTQINILASRTGISIPEARKLFQFGSELRKNSEMTDISLRQLIAFGEQLVLGASYEDAALCTFANAWDDGDEDAGFKSVMQALQLAYDDIKKKMPIGIE